NDLPSERVENQKTGFGELLKVGDHEVVLSQDDSGNVIRLFRNNFIGDDNWTETSGSGLVHGLFPIAYCPEGTEQIYLVNINANTKESLFFSRSDDGGESWSVNEYTLPYTEEAYGIDLVQGDNYQIKVHGSDVY